MLSLDPNLVIHALNVKPWRDLSWHTDFLLGYTYEWSPILNKYEKNEWLI